MLIEVPTQTADLLKRLSAESNHPLEQLFNQGMQLLMAALTAKRRGHRLIVHTADGEPLKELVVKV